MANENLDTTNKLIKPEDISPSDDEVIRQLSENLQDVTPEDINAMCDEMDELKKKEEERKRWEIPQELKDFRELWKEKIEDVDDDIKRMIEDAAMNIPVKVETESDGSRLIEFELEGKQYKILDPKIENYTDNEYKWAPDYNSIIHIDYLVGLGGMWGDKTWRWGNKKLAKYVKKKISEGFHIPSENEMVKLLGELGKLIDSDNIPDQIAMLMYLIGIDGGYRLSMNELGSRSKLVCNNNARKVSRLDMSCYYANLCLIACE